MTTAIRKLDGRALLELAEELDGTPLPGRRMTEKQFVDWYWQTDEHVRAEWVDGEVILMTPDNVEHEDLNGWIVGLLKEYIRGRDGGIVLGSRVQIRLPKVRARREPDVLFVSKPRLDIVKQTYVDGPPDLVMEIVSPSSVSRDWRNKFLNYERGGVPEYWIIDPTPRTVEAYAINPAGKYERILEKQGRIKSKAMKGLSLKPEWLWERPSYFSVLKQIADR